MQSCFHGLLPTFHALWEELGCSGEGQLEAQPCGRCWGETTVGRIRAWRWLRVSPDIGWWGCPWAAPLPLREWPSWPPTQAPVLRFGWT